MSSVDTIAAVTSREDRPAWVRFERVAVENTKETVKQGKWVGNDVDFVFITSPYSKDEHPKKVSAWLDQLTLYVIQGRVSQQRKDYYVSQYEAWKNGQELPVDGTPIKGWGMISPAQQQALVSVRILTVEDLAGINDDGIRQVGMGAVDMKQKAVAWLAQTAGKGPLTVKMAALAAENRTLLIEVDTLKTQVAELMRQAKTAAYTMPTETPGPAPTQHIIVAEDLLPEPDDSQREQLQQMMDPPAQIRRRGNPNWIRKTVES